VPINATDNESYPITKHTLEYRDGNLEGQIREIRKFIVHRMERGFVE